jgi:hypothetical protein
MSFREAAARLRCIAAETREVAGRVDGHGVVGHLVARELLAIAAVIDDNARDADRAADQFGEPATEAARA